MGKYAFDLDALALDPRGRRMTENVPSVRLKLRVKVYVRMVGTQGGTVCNCAQVYAFDFIVGRFRTLFRGVGFPFGVHFRIMFDLFVDIFPE